jgi:NADPH:quinone reductase-like Zn-dependent oxidoreductase
MTTMTAVVQDRYGSPDRVLKLQEVSRPAIGEEDVLVRVRATSVNTPDWIAVTGIPKVLRLRSGLRRPSQLVRGSDLAGIVEAVGNRVTGFVPGDEVFGSTWNGTLATISGTFAEYAAVSASQLARKPATLDFQQAAGSVMSGLTALMALRDVAGVRPDSRVLINGASGGVGTFAVQIAKVLGADVTGVCSTRNIELVRSLGASQVIDYTKDDFTRSDKRYDVILDNVMNHPPSETARVLDTDGILIPNSIGNAGGLLAGLPRMAHAALIGRGSTDVRLVTLDVTRERLEALAALLDGGIRVVVDRTYPLEKASDGVAHMLGHRARGKVVIAVPPASTPSPNVSRKASASTPPLSAKESN